MGRPRWARRAPDLAALVTVVASRPRGVMLRDHQSGAGLMIEYQRNWLAGPRWIVERYPAEATVDAIEAIENGALRAPIPYRRYVISGAVPLVVGSDHAFVVRPATDAERYATGAVVVPVVDDDGPPQAIRKLTRWAVRHGVLHVGPDEARELAAQLQRAEILDGEG